MELFHYVFNFFPDFFFAEFIELQLSNKLYVNDGSNLTFWAIYAVIININIINVSSLHKVTVCVLKIFKIYQANFKHLKLITLCVHHFCRWLAGLVYPFGIYHSVISMFLNPEFWQPIFLLLLLLNSASTDSKHKWNYIVFIFCIWLLLLSATLFCVFQNITNGSLLFMKCE